jgi:hypothetical protein
MASTEGPPSRARWMSFNVNCAGWCSSTRSPCAATRRRGSTATPVRGDPCHQQPAGITSAFAASVGPNYAQLDGGLPLETTTLSHDGTWAGGEESVSPPPEHHPCCCPKEIDTLRGVPDWRRRLSYCLEARDTAAGICRWSGRAGRRSKGDDMSLISEPVRRCSCAQCNSLRLDRRH